MNYNSVVLVGVVVLTAAWWLIHARKNYPGPKVMVMYVHEGRPVEGQAVKVPSQGGVTEVGSDEKAGKGEGKR